MNSPSYDAASIREALSAFNLGPIRYHEQTGSTNEDAARWAEKDAPDLALVVADEQTAGRGRAGRRWHTRPGAALAFSLVLKDPPGSIPSNLLTRMTALGALAVSQALDDLYGLQSKIKWPNDVLLDHSKVAGVLAEALWQGEHLQAVILGIGVNITPSAIPDFSELAFPASCVEAFTDRSVDRLELLKAILAQVMLWRPQLSTPAFLQAWEDRLAFKNEWVTVFYPEKEPGVAGREQVVQVLGLDPDGALFVRDRAGVHFSLTGGEVRLRPRHS